MDRTLDRSLDEILRDRKQTNRDSNDRAPRGNRGGNGGNSGGGRRRGERSDYPRDGVRKSFRDDAPRNLDSEWVHDRFEDHGSRRSTPRRRHSPDQHSDSKGSRIRVDNIHYELTQEDLEELFQRIGPLVKLDMKYDRAGRSEGTAFVTYESARDAAQAIKEFDGANAAGQPIRLTLMPTGPRRNPFDNAVVPIPGRPLAERITAPTGRSRSLSPQRYSDEEAARRGVDRYRPGARGSRSRSPMPARRRDGGGGGRRGGLRRDGGGGSGGGGTRRGGGNGGGGGGGGERSEKTARDGRPKKTQEELDAEMEDYFGGGGGAAPAQNTSGAVAQQNIGEDIDMIE